MKALLKVASSPSTDCKRAQHTLEKLVSWGLSAARFQQSEERFQNIFLPLVLFRDEIITLS